MNGHLDEYIVSLVLMLIAVVIAFGKGDFLISGYNTASKEKKAKYNVHRLRLLVFSSLAIISAGISVAAILDWSEAEREYLTGGMVSVLVIYVILGQTWAKRDNQ